MWKCAVQSWVWAMARERLFLGFEPWLRSTFLGGLSHGSGPHFRGVWAIAQDPLIIAFEPWLRNTFFEVLKVKNFRFYLTFLYWVRLGKSMGRRPKSSLQGLAVVQLCHGSNLKKGVPEPWLWRFSEPWLKPPKNGVPSHGSNSTLYCTF